MSGEIQSQNIETNANRPDVGNPNVAITDEGPNHGNPNQRPDAGSRNPGQRAHGDQALITQLAESVEKQEERVLKLESHVFQLANYNFVFQGVILTAILQGSSNLNCRYFWLPMSLSLTATLLNFLTLLAIAAKYNHSLNLLDEKTETWYICAYGRGSPTFDRLQKKNRKRSKRRSYALYAALALVLVFSVLIASATRLIPCAPHKCN